MEKTETAAPAYGPGSNSEYLTPYQMTVVYRPESVFESTIAFLSDRAQLIPVDANTDLSCVSDICEHPSPEVLIFGSNFSRDDLMKFFTRGFQLIHVFSYNPSEVYQDKNEDGMMESFDERVVSFDISNLYDHLCLIQGLTSMYLIEYIACASFPNYKSIIDEKTINCTTGRHLLRAVEFSKRELGMVLLQLCGSADGFDKITQLIIRGQSIAEVSEHIASERLNKGTFFELEVQEKLPPREYVGEEMFDVSEEPPTQKYTTYAVSGIDLMNEMLNLAPIHPQVVKAEANFVLFYNVESHDIDNAIYPGWRVTLVGIKNAPNACEVLKNFSPEFTIGTHGIASTWVPTGKARNLLSFIYP